jgi:hypothetical protein
MRKRLYSERRKKLNEQPTKLNGRKRTQKLRGNQRLRRSVSSPMRKRLEPPPKGDAKALPKDNQVLARGCESGLSLKSLIQNILSRGFTISLSRLLSGHKKELAPRIIIVGDAPKSRQHCDAWELCNRTLRQISRRKLTGERRPARGLPNYSDLSQKLTKSWAQARKINQHPGLLGIAL